MKKPLIFALTAMMLLTLSACGGSQANQPTNKPSAAVPTETPASTHEPSKNEVEAGSQPTSTGEPQPNNAANVLVVYFSMPETTNPDNMTKAEHDSTVVINGEVLGNTQYVAYLIEQNAGADIFRIEPKTPYPMDHDTLTDLAKDEQNNTNGKL